MGMGVSFWDMVMRLLISMVLGSLIGIEREMHGRPAGLRTHALVCVGSTIFAMASFFVGPWKAANDQSRIAAQIVSGVGFLGAGTIIQHGSAIRGLTTAASIWTAAAIGLAVAMGGPMLYVALVATALVLGTLHLMDRVEKHITLGNDERFITIVVRQVDVHLCDVLRILQTHHVQIRSVDSKEHDEPLVQSIRLRLRVGRDFDEVALASDLASSQHVISYSWE